MLKGIKFVFSVSIVLFQFAAFSQQEALKKTEQFYKSLNAGDSLALKSMFHPQGYVMHVGSDTTFGFSAEEFLGVCPNFYNGVFQEKIHSIIALEIAPQILTVKIEFEFYLNGKYSHCGIDHFTWIVKNGELKIETILSTDNVTCGHDLETTETGEPDEIIELNRLMDNWHKDVAQIELEAYFDFMADDFYFLGTDPSERWSKKEFRSFCEPYFNEKKSTWDFKPIQRNWGISADGSTAWFDESLNTWMEECRGSGVIKKINGQWKIVHYNLTVLIENEKMDKFIKLRKK